MSKAGAATAAASAQFCADLPQLCYSGDDTDITK
jgi:hypothetical protein